MSRDPFQSARNAGIRVEIADIGHWSPVLLIAEYDAHRRVIRINARAVERLRKRRGEDAARALCAAAIAHELAHLEVQQHHPRTPRERSAIESAVNAHATATYGLDGTWFEQLLR